MNKLEQCAAASPEWADDNAVRFETSKTEAILFSRKTSHRRCSSAKAIGNHQKLCNERRQLLNQIQDTLESAVNHIKEDRSDLASPERQEAQALIKTLQHLDYTVETANFKRLRTSLEFYEYRAELFRGAEDEEGHIESVEDCDRKFKRILEGENPFKDGTNEAIRIWESEWQQVTGMPLFDKVEEDPEDETLRLIPQPPGQYLVTPKASTVEGTPVTKRAFPNFYTWNIKAEGLCQKLFFAYQIKGFHE